MTGFAVTPSACLMPATGRSHVRLHGVHSSTQSTKCCVVVSTCCRCLRGRSAGSDTVLDSRHWTTSVVGKLSPWLQLDSSIPQVRKASEKVWTPHCVLFRACIVPRVCADPCRPLVVCPAQAFAQEMAWASHLSVPAIMLPTPEFACFNYSAAVNRFLAASSFLHVRVDTGALWVTHC